jgi:hypothetical protein
MSPEPSTEQRLREVETIGTIVQTSMKAMHQDISDLKNMFSKVISDSVKIAELQAKVRSVDSLSQRVDSLNAMLGNLNNELIIIKSKHDVCILGRGEEGQVLKLLQDKINSIESNNIRIGNSLENLEKANDSLNKSKGKVEDVLWKWGERIGWLIIISILAMALNGKPSYDFKVQTRDNPSQAYSDSLPQGKVGIE